MRDLGHAGSGDFRHEGALWGGWTTAQLVEQLIGIGAIGAFTLLFCLVIGSLLKTTMGLRVSPEEEMKGLDIGEHGMEAYSLMG